MIHDMEVASFVVCGCIGLAVLVILAALAWMKAWDCILKAMRVHKLACQFIFTEERKRPKEAQDAR